MAAAQRATVRATRMQGKYIRASLHVKGRATPIYVEVPLRMGLKVGDNVEVISAPRGTKAKQGIGYRVRKI